VSTSGAERAVKEATLAATRQVIRLGIEPDSPVDVFGAIESSRVWLFFEELESLFGFFQRSGETTGIALNKAHPLRLQRFTAAHEYGHFVLGHLISQDGRKEVFGGPSLPLQELQAQAFAAEFLMPLALVNRALARLSLPEEPKQIGAAETYQLSLEIGASYRATVSRLNELNKISFPHAEALRGYEPKEMKVELGGGRAPQESQAAVFSIEEGLRERRLFMRQGDELHVRLTEVPSSGYRWALGSGGEGLELLSDKLEHPVPHGKRLGGAANRHLWWRALEPLVGTLVLVLVREWQGAAAEPADTLALPISIEAPRHDTELGTGLAEPQREAILAGG
jgi:Zn-dependent peptidase ImmA (M78 family)/predicted secreted protein